MTSIIINRVYNSGQERKVIEEEIASRLHDEVSKALDKLGSMASYIEFVIVGPESNDGIAPMSFYVDMSVGDLPESELFGKVADYSKVQALDGRDNLYRHILDRVQKLVENTKYRLEQRLGKLNDLLAELKGDEGLPGVIPFEEPTISDVLAGVELSKGSAPIAAPPFIPECPNCPECEHKTVSDGGCYKCLNCGASVGTS